MLSLGVCTVGMGTVGACTVGMGTVGACTFNCGGCTVEETVGNALLPTGRGTGKPVVEGRLTLGVAMLT